jgi:hypothetical protein
MRCPALRALSKILLRWELLADFGDLSINEAIVHLVPRRLRTDLQDSEIQLSQAVCQLSGGVRTELQGKLRDVLDRLGREVVEDPEAKSELPDRVRDFLEGRQDLVEVSGDLARLLRDSQTGVSPTGLLLVASARLAGQPAVLLVKLEQETGMQANQITTEDGLRTFDVQYFANLLFTEKSRVYKVALFSAAGNTEQGLEGWAADRQMTGKALARFFLEKYLGCRHKDEPRELTRRFHDIAVEWINTRFSDPEIRIPYLMAVMVELQSPRATINPADFARDHLQRPHRDDFQEFLEANDLALRTFDKDIDLVAGRLQKMRVDFADGVYLVAPLESIDETVTFQDLGDGHTQVTVNGTMTTTKSFSPPGGGKRSRPGRSDSPEAGTQGEAVEGGSGHGSDGQ